MTTRPDGIPRIRNLSPAQNRWPINTSLPSVYSRGGIGGFLVIPDPWLVNTHSSINPQ
jgi:hypothetical protein